MNLINKSEAFLKNLFGQLVDLFKTHPKTDAFHMTADGQFFFEKNHADAQAQRLPVKDVATIIRDQVATPEALAADLSGVVEAAPAVTSPGDETLAQPEASTVLTGDEIQAKASADAAASTGFAAQLNTVQQSAAPVEVAQPAVPAAETIEAAAPEAVVRKLKVVKHIVTAEDLALNPNDALTIGEEIDIPVSELIGDGVEDATDQAAKTTEL